MTIEEVAKALKKDKTLCFRRLKHKANYNDITVLGSGNRIIVGHSIFGGFTLENLLATDYQLIIEEKL